MRATPSDVLDQLERELAERGYFVMGRKVSQAHGALILRQEISFEVLARYSVEENVFWVTHNITDELRWSFKKLAWLDFGVVGSHVMEEIEDILRYSSNVEIVSVVS